VRSVGELDYSVSGGGLHGRNLGHGAVEAKLKLGGRAYLRGQTTLEICEN